MNKRLIIGLGFIGIIVFLMLGYHERHWIKQTFLPDQTQTDAKTQKYKKNSEDLLTLSQIKKNLQPVLAKKAVDESSKQSAAYTRQLNALTTGIDHAKVIVNPYKTSPLSALILVKTDRASKLIIQVKGDTSATTITHATSSYKKKHQIGVLGLYANRTNQVTVTFVDRSGQKTTKQFQIKTGELPSSIGHNKLVNSQPEKMALGKGNGRLTFAVGSQGITYGLDADGAVRWYATNEISHIFKKLANGRLLILTKKQADDSKYNALQETDFYGRVYKQYDFSGQFPTKANPKIAVENTVIHHDAIELPNHDFLLTVDDGSAKYVEDTMIQIDRNTGAVKKVIDLKRILPKTAYTNYTATQRPDGKIDWFHQNAMYYDQQRNELIVSGRNQSMVFAIDYQTDQLKWILAAPQKLPKAYQKYVLTPTSKDFKYNGGQHSVRLIHTNKNNGDSIELEYYDNNVAVTRGDWAQSKKYSMGAIVSINEKKKTVQELWSYGRERGSTNFTNIVGSSYDVGEGNTLINFGYADEGKRSEIVEVDRKTNQVVFDVNRTGIPSGDWTYRAERISLY